MHAVYCTECYHTYLLCSLSMSQEELSSNNMSTLPAMDEQLRPQMVVPRASRVSVGAKGDEGND